MIRVKSIQRYADSRGIPLKDAFWEAWMYHFGHTPNIKELWQDVHKYKEYRAVPEYVATFLDSPASEHINRTPVLRLPALA